MKAVHKPTGKAVKILRASNLDRTQFEVERKGRRFTVLASDLERIQPRKLRQTIVRDPYSQGPYRGH